MTKRINPVTTAIPAKAYELYDKYAHGLLNRRDFLTAIGGLALGTTAVASVLGGLLPNYALAEQVSFNDPDITASYQTFPSPEGHGEGRGYLVKPAKTESLLPTVLVIHENRGLNPYIEDVARRLAKAGFIAFAPDALWPVGGYPGNDDDGRQLQRSMDGQKIVADFKAAARWLTQLAGSSGKLGVVGFCFGGAITGLLAAELPELVDAGVPFYGSPPPADKIANIKAPLLVQLAGLDTRVNEMWPEAEALMQQHKVQYQVHRYAGSHHGFHNDSTTRYNKEMAELAWQRTVTFFRQHLG